MPQMYPLLWFLMFSLTILALLSMASILYFSTQNSPKNLNTNITNTENMTWKW